jgi:hypothetical protein
MQDRLRFGPDAPDDIPRMDDHASLGGSSDVRCDGRVHTPDLDGHVLDDTDRHPRSFEAPGLDPIEPPADAATDLPLLHAAEPARNLPTRSA